MKKTLLIFLFLTNIAFGQNPDEQNSVSKIENLNWIEKLEKIEAKKQKIASIIQKIKLDSVVKFDNYSDRIVIEVRKGENINDAIDKKTNCKIVFVLLQGNVGHLLDLNQYPNYSVALKYLTEDTIDSVEILKGEKATSLYGSRAICGVVVMKSGNRKLKKLIRKSLRKEKTNA
jgi:hypothetical protein